GAGPGREASDLAETLLVNAPEDLDPGLDEAPVRLPGRELGPARRQRARRRVRFDIRPAAACGRDREPPRQVERDDFRPRPSGRRLRERRGGVQPVLAEHELLATEPGDVTRRRERPPVNAAYD